MSQNQTSEVKEIDEEADARQKRRQALLTYIANDQKHPDQIINRNIKDAIKIINSRKGLPPKEICSTIENRSADTVLTTAPETSPIMEILSPDNEEVFV